MGSFKIQYQCAVSTYESMEQKYDKFEDSQGYLETPVFLSPGCFTPDRLGIVPVLSVDGAVFLQ